MSDLITPNLADALERVADLFPHDTAITFGCETVTWLQFDDRASRLASYLGSNGVRPGSRVALGLRNSPEYLIALFAVMKLRAVAVNVNYRYEAPELEYILLDSEAAVILFDDLLVNSVTAFVRTHPGVVSPVRCRASGLHTPVPDEAVLEAAWESEPAPRSERGDDEWLLYTGGTTGAPKAVSRAHSTVLSLVSNQGWRLAGHDLPASEAEWAEALLEVHPRRLAIAVAAPLMHGTGIYNALAALVTGGSAVLIPSVSFDARVLAQELQDRSATDLAIVGDVFAVPLVGELERAAAEGHPYDLSALRRITSTGTVWSASVKARLLEMIDVQLIDIIAATEGGPYAMAVSNRSTPFDQLSVFRLAPGARVVTDDGEDVERGSGKVGVLAALAAPMRYTRDPAKTASTWREIDGRLYSIPGDLASVGTDGSLTFMGRGSSVINTGGEKVYVEEVADVLRTHPAVNDVVVVGVPDEKWGSRVAAVVERASGSDVGPDDLLEVANGVLARYKRPRSIVVVDELARTTTGKIDLRWAAKTVVEQQQSPTQTPPVSGITSKEND